MTGKNGGSLSGVSGSAAVVPDSTLPIAGNCVKWWGNEVRKTVVDAARGTVASVTSVAGFAGISTLVSATATGGMGILTKSFGLFDRLEVTFFPPKDIWNLMLEEVGFETAGQDLLNLTAKILGVTVASGLVAGAAYKVLEKMRPIKATKIPEVLPITAALVVLGAYTFGYADNPAKFITYTLELSVATGVVASVAAIFERCGLINTSKWHYLSFSNNK